MDEELSGRSHSTAQCPSDIPQGSVLGPAHHILGSIKSSMSSSSREVIFPLYSAPVRPHWECCISSEVISTRKTLLEGGQRKATKNGQRNGASLLWSKAERVGTV